MKTWHESETEVSRRFKANSKKFQIHEHAWTRVVLTMFGDLSGRCSKAMDWAVSGAPAKQIRASHSSSVNACASSACVNVRTKWRAQSMYVVVRDPQLCTS